MKNRGDAWRFYRNTMELYWTLWTRSEHRTILIKFFELFWDTSEPLQNQYRTLQAERQRAFMEPRSRYEAVLKLMEPAGTDETCWETMESLWISMEPLGKCMESSCNVLLDSCGSSWNRTGLRGNLYKLWQAYRPLQKNLFPPCHF